MILLTGGTPGRVFMKRRHRACDHGSIRAEILFIYDTTFSDDESHDSGGSIFGRIRDEELRCAI